MPQCWVGSQYAGVSDMRPCSPRWREISTSMSWKCWPGHLQSRPLPRNTRIYNIRLMMDNTSAVPNVNHMGGTQISQTVGCCPGSVDMVPRQRDDCISRVPPRRTEHHSRFLLKIHHRISEMEAGSLCLPASTKKVCTNSGRHLCNKDQHPAGTVYLLETRPFRNGNGCIVDYLDKYPRLRLPDLLPLGEVSAEDCQRSGSSCLSPLYGSVPYSTGHVSGDLGTVTPLLLDPFNQPHPMLSSSPPWKRFTSTGVSEQATSLITAGWSEGANTAYQSAWSRWQRWCVKMGLDPFSASVTDFINFLSVYRSINTIRNRYSSYDLKLILSAVELLKKYNRSTSSQSIPLLLKSATENNF